MIKLRLHGTSEEIQKFTEYFKSSPEFLVLSCSEPYADKGKSVYERVYMDIEYTPPVEPIVINLENSGECPYKGNTNGKGICTLTLQPTNGAVMCDFEYEDCPFFQHCEKYKKRNSEGEK